MKRVYMDRFIDAIEWVAALAYPLVPAKAGTQLFGGGTTGSWIPACAGMSGGEIAAHAEMQDQNTAPRLADSVAKKE